MHLDLNVGIARTGKPQHWFAEQISVSDSEPGKYLRGDGGLHLDQFEKFAALLGLQKEFVGEQGR